MSTKVSPSLLANTAIYGISINGNAATATSVSSGSWTISISGTKVYFAYNGTNVFSVDSTGNIIAKGDITGFGTP